MDSATELVRKLGVKAHSLVVAINANLEILAKIQECLPEGAILLTDLPPETQANIILVWLTERDDSYQVFQRLRHAIVPDGAIWAVIPKKVAAKKKAESFTFAQVQAAALQTDLVDNKVVSLSGEEYGIRFVIRRERRGV